MCPKILVSINNRYAEWLDKWVQRLNSKRQGWQNPTNRQAIIIACMEYARDHDFHFSCRGYSKYVIVDNNKK